jgi:hypothetical protein
MILNWFSPLPPENTDIAQYTVRVLEALQSLVPVRVWTQQAKWQSVECGNKVSFDPECVNADTLNEADISVYNIGNNSDFHSGIWEVSRRYPGVVVLHDERLQHLFADYMDKRRDPASYTQCMRQYYGLKGMEAAIACLLGHCTAEALSELYPLTDLALENCLGIVVHSPSLYDRLQAEQLCPIAYSPLPYPPTSAERRAAWTMARRRYPEMPVRLAVFGSHMGPNRRLEPLLRVLGSMEEKHAFLMDIYGTVWDSSHIRQVVEDVGLGAQVRLHGFVDAIDDALATADCVINLHYPTMGEASEAQLRIWDHGLPSIVADVDWYHTLPREVVEPVAVEHEIEGLQQILRSLLTDPFRYKSIGQQGRLFLDNNHSPMEYANAIIQISQQADRFRSVRAALNLAERAASASTVWTTGVRGPLLMNERLAETISGIIRSRDGQTTAGNDHTK